jgi:hypothetical protein
MCSNQCRAKVSQWDNGRTVYQPKFRLDSITKGQNGKEYTNSVAMTLPELAAIYEICSTNKALEALDDAFSAFEQKKQPKAVQKQPKAAPATGIDAVLAAVQVMSAKLDQQQAEIEALKAKPRRRRRTKAEMEAARAAEAEG